jgi:hypothetical protein
VGTDTLEDGLASARTSDDVLSSLGSRRVRFYDVALVAVALGFSGVTAYLLVAVAAGWKGPWVLGWTLALIPLSAFSGMAAVSALHRRVTGKTRPPSKRMVHIYERLNDNI